MPRQHDGVLLFQGVNDRSQVLAQVVQGSGADHDLRRLKGHEFGRTPYTNALILPNGGGMYRTPCGQEVHMRTLASARPYWPLVQAVLTRSPIAMPEPSHRLLSRRLSSRMIALMTGQASSGESKGRGGMTRCQWPMQPYLRSNPQPKRVGVQESR